MMLFVFLGFVHYSVPGYFAILLFFGNWLVFQHFLKDGLLKKLLDGKWHLMIAIWFAAILFCFAWEGMDLPLQDWAYTNLFWLEPRILGIPLVAFFGYFCWYALYLDVYELFVKE